MSRDTYEKKTSLGDVVEKRSRKKAMRPVSESRVVKAKRWGVGTLNEQGIKKKKKQEKRRSQEGT